MKVMAMYLPQFHRVKENDEWWGEGFTDWVAAKSAKPLYEGHYQPHVPLNGYYDLEKKETMQWQADLMKQYQVDGMCFYHYWFKDGRKILERPAENLLRWTDIDMPFCFAWANQSWVRSWSKYDTGAVWSYLNEKKADSTEDGILLKQEYGEEEEWRAHFEYLLPFFRDRRYIKIQGHPVFVIYLPDNIYCLDRMLEFWEKLACDEGMETPYVILTNSKKKYAGCAKLLHEPVYTRSYLKSAGGKKCVWELFDYGKIWREILSRPIKNSETVFQGGFVGFDTTPRKGNAGTIVDGASPVKFRQYITELMAKNYVSGSEWVFINAWNEWGEGMHLEPDVKDGYAYLEAIPYAKEHYEQYVDKYLQLKSRGSEHTEQEMLLLEEQNAKYAGYWRMLDRWLQLKEDGVSIARNIMEKGYSEVAVYGMGMLGRHLLYDFETEQVPIKYIIDRKSDAVNTDIPVYTLSDDLPTADVIIVTPVYDWDNIKQALSEVTTAKLLRLDELLMECE